MLLLLDDLFWKEDAIFLKECEFMDIDLEEFEFLLAALLLLLFAFGDCCGL